MKLVAACWSSRYAVVESESERSQETWFGVEMFQVPGIEIVMEARVSMERARMRMGSIENDSIIERAVLERFREDAACCDQVGCGSVGDLERKAALRTCGPSMVMGVFLGVHRAEFASEQWRSLIPQLGIANMRCVSRRTVFHCQLLGTVH